MAYNIDARPAESQPSESQAIEKYSLVGGSVHISGFLSLRLPNVTSTP